MRGLARVIEDKRRQPEQKMGLRVHGKLLVLRWEEGEPTGMLLRVSVEGAIGDVWVNVVLR